MADYSDLSLEELLERMKEVMEKQKGKHSGGSHWVGTGGISPYGHGGAAKDGIRMGGTGGGKMARKVLGDASFYPVDLDALLNDDNVDAALAALKGVLQVLPTIWKPTISIIPSITTSIQTPRDANPFLWKESWPKTLTTVSLLLAMRPWHLMN